MLSVSLCEIDVLPGHAYVCVVLPTTKALQQKSAVRAMRAFVEQATSLVPILFYHDADLHGLAVSTRK